jgi:hypothetical protein
MPDIYGNQSNAQVLSQGGIGETNAMTNSYVDAIGDALNNGAGTNKVFGTDPNILASQWRSNGIPDGAQANYDFLTVTAQFSEAAPEKDWRVRISCPLITGASSIMAPLTTTNGMIFPYLPQITMSHSANYQQMDIAHMNYPFYAYKNSQVDEIQIQGKFTVQDRVEADYWVASVHFLRTVTKMFFGIGQNLGNPPPICTLNGYGDFVYKDVSCVIKNFTVTMPNDVDYIQAGSGGSGSSVTYVPVSSDISVTVQPVYSREKIKSFDLTAFANGQLVLGSDGKGFI